MRTRWKLSRYFPVISAHKYILGFKQLSSCSRLRNPNAMDPKVEKLLEGKSTEYKFQAIAFSVACTLTRPTGNTSPEISILDREFFVLSTRTVVSLWIRISISLPHNLVFILCSQVNSKEVKKKWKGRNFHSKKRAMKKNSTVCFYSVVVLSFHHHIRIACKSLWILFRCFAILRRFRISSSMYCIILQLLCESWNFCYIKCVLCLSCFRLTN